jgi:chromo domain-containing protein 1
MVIYLDDFQRKKLLDPPQGQPASDPSLSKMRFFIPDRMPEVGSKTSHILATGLDLRHYAVIVGETILHLEQDRIMDSKAIEVVFLMIPPAFATELEVYTKIFQAMKCKVYSAATPGAWTFFRRIQRKRSLVLLHSEVLIHQIPGLFEYLINKDAVFFAAPTNREATLTRKFPHATAILITDDVLVHHPEKAVEIVHNFLAASSHKPVGGEFSKIVARPGLKKYVWQNLLERNPADLRYRALWGTICDLCPPEAEDDDDPSEEFCNPLEESCLVSLPPEEMPSYADLWESKEEAASDALVDWFAWYCVLHSHEFRKFIVCYQPKHDGTTPPADEGACDPRGWGKKYQHLGVLPPKKVTARFMQPPARGPAIETRSWVVSTRNG